MPAAGDAKKTEVRATPRTEHTLRYLFCQSCRQRILLDDSTIAFVDTAAGSGKTAGECGDTKPGGTAAATCSQAQGTESWPEDEAQRIPFRREIHERAPPLPIESFVLLHQDTDEGDETVSVLPERHVAQHSPATDTRLQQLRSMLSLDPRLARVSDFLKSVSAHSTIDHPLCEDCSDLVLAELATRLAAATKERTKFSEALKKLELRPFSSDEAVQTRLESENLQKQQQRMFKQIQDLEAERLALAEERERLEEEEKEIEKLEEEYLKGTNEFEEAYASFLEQKQSLESQFEHAEAQLATLSNCNILADIFRITLPSSEPFGMINSFRLGKTAAKPPMEWPELNAGLGQICLLLDTLATKNNFSFGHYKLCPMGSFSRIEKEVPPSGKVSYDLFVAGGELNIGRLWWNRRLDNGLIGLLACVKMLGDHVEAQDVNFHLPYRIYKDKIGEISIRLQFSQDESWTRAMRHLLTNLHWLMTWHAARQRHHRFQ